MKTLIFLGIMFLIFQQILYNGLNKIRKNKLSFEAELEMFRFLIIIFCFLIVTALMFIAELIRYK